LNPKIRRFPVPPKFSRELTRSVSFDAGPPVDQPRTSPCEINCPAGHAIQRTIYLIQNERFEEALENIWAKHPFPGICGRACFHPCEQPCNRQFYDEPISVRALERAAFDLADWSRVKRPKAREKTDKKVAIIGSGPAGLTCAYFLALFGHSVTVFEAQSGLGGMARYGIPDYRLPKDVVDREVAEVLNLGVITKTSTKVGEDISMQEIMENFDACIIATGAWKDKRLDIPGSDLARTSLPLLQRVSREDHPQLGERILILGGGGVAFDVAGTVRRLGAKEVHVACLEPRDRMIAPEEDIKQAEEEGVILHNTKTFSRILSEKGEVTGVECLEVQSFTFHPDGSLDVEKIEGSEHVVHADTVVFAVGVVPDFHLLDGIKGFQFTPMGSLVTDDHTLSTGVKGVFAAGDAVTGPSSVAEAIGTGRRAAIGVECFLNNRQLESIKSITLDEEARITLEDYNNGEKAQAPQQVIGYDEILNPDYYAKENRVIMSRLSREESCKSFSEIFEGYTKEEAIHEANRCFHCGHCAVCGTCADICPMDIITMIEDGPEVVYPKECWHCGGCRINCPCGAIYYEFPLSMLI
jgi:NADPH-dependent glutamate synthase beta subunit-like oxidoreductase